MALATATIIAGIGLAIGAFGAYKQYEGQKDAEKEQKKQEKLRQQQMNLDAMRRRRQVLRQMALARAQSRANAAGQGVQGGDSAVLGGQYQAVATAAGNLQGINQSQEIGAGLFQSNSALASAQGTAALGQQIGGFGMQVAQNSQTIARVGATQGLWKESYDI